LVTWRVLPEWAEQIGSTHGDGWQQRRLTLRLYDVTLVEFDGFNAHRIVDFPLEQLTGERIFGLEVAGKVELAEVGFLLQDGAFVPAARSCSVQFPSGAVVPEYDPSALFVDAELRPEPVPTPWEASHWLRHRGTAKLRDRLRIALCAFESNQVGDPGASAAFVGELARELARIGHDVHVAMPRRYELSEDRRIDGVDYHPVELGSAQGPLELSQAFGQAARARLDSLGRFELRHAHEWMAGGALGAKGVPRLLSLSSTEAIRAGTSPLTELSQRIQRAEQTMAGGADCVFVPDRIHSHACSHLGFDEDHVIAFPLEGRFLDEWERPLDLGQVKHGLGLGPLDRVFLFVGPIEWGAGPDLMVEALPTLLGRHNACRLVFVGLGGMLGHLEHRARQLGVEYAVRCLGHLEGEPLVRVVRAAEAVVLPSRQREAFDEGVVSLARRAGRAVITTHRGPSHLVGHEQNGLVTYDNPGSIVWAIGQFLADPQQAELLGTLGRSIEDRCPQWADLAASYTELCADLFPVLTRA
jgi:glycosyltransferase involved in cell wall biosynthesis